MTGLRSHPRPKDCPTGTPLIAHLPSHTARIRSLAAYAASRNPAKNGASA